MKKALLDALEKAEEEMEIEGEVKENLVYPFMFFRKQNNFFFCQEKL